MSCAKSNGFQRQPNMDARVVELVDSLASGASARKGVRVRLPPRAPEEKHLLSADVFSSSLPNKSVDNGKKLWYYLSHVERNASTPTKYGCASGGIGRLAGFRCQCSQGRAGSTPASRTKKEEHLLGRCSSFFRTITKREQDLILQSSGQTFLSGSKQFLQATNYLKQIFAFAD